MEASKARTVVAVGYVSSRLRKSHYSQDEKFRASFDQPERHLLGWLGGLNGFDLAQSRDGNGFIVGGMPSRMVSGWPAGFGPLNGRTTRLGLLALCLRAFSLAHAHAQ